MGGESCQIGGTVGHYVAPPINQTPIHSIGGLLLTMVGSPIPYGLGRAADYWPDLRSGHSGASPRTAAKRLSRGVPLLHPFAVVPPKGLPS